MPEKTTRSANDPSLAQAIWKRYTTPNAESVKSFLYKMDRNPINRAPLYTDIQKRWLRAAGVFERGGGLAMPFVALSARAIRPSEHQENWFEVQHQPAREINASNKSVQKKAHPDISAPDRPGAEQAALHGMTVSPSLASSGSQATSPIYPDQQEKTVVIQRKPSSMTLIQPQDEVTQEIQHSSDAHPSDMHKRDRAGVSTITVKPDLEFTGTQPTLPARLDRREQVVAIQRKQSSATPLQSPATYIPEMVHSSEAHVQDQPSIDQSEVPVMMTRAPLRSWNIPPVSSGQMITVLPAESEFPVSRVRESNALNGNTIRRKSPSQASGPDNSVQNDLVMNNPGLIRNQTQRSYSVDQSLDSGTSISFPSDLEQNHSAVETGFTIQRTPLVTLHSPSDAMLPKLSFTRPTQMNTDATQPNYPDFIQARTNTSELSTWPVLQNSLQREAIPEENPVITHTMDSTASSLNTSPTVHIESNQAEVMDIDAIAERVMQIASRRLAIERERRGFGRWH
jgi:hypothetical protein